MKKITKKLLSAVFVLFAFMVMYPAFSVKADVESLQYVKKTTLTYYSKNDVSSKKTRDELNKYTLSWIIHGTTALIAEIRVVTVF